MRHLLQSKPGTKISNKYLMLLHVHVKSRYKACAYTDSSLMELWHMNLVLILLTSLYVYYKQYAGFYFITLQIVHNPA